MFTRCTLETLDNGQVEFIGKDIGCTYKSAAAAHLPLEGALILHKAVYNRVVQQFNKGEGLSVRATTFSDAPPGSGLGSSSTLVVAILAAYRELLGLRLGEYDLAHLAFEIERIDCGLAGGKQDQYAATFGGFNFMEFYRDDRVIVNPLRIPRQIENELQNRLMLYFTGVSRDSARIIEDQIRSTNHSGESDGALDGMHEIKLLAVEMKEKLLKGDIDGMASLFNTSWAAKKKLSKAISNARIEEIVRSARDAGAEAVKISGAGGGIYDAVCGPGPESGHC